MYISVISGIKLQINDIVLLAQCEVDGDFEKFEEVGDEFFSSLTDERIEDLKVLHGIKQGWLLQLFSFLFNCLSREFS